MMVQLSSWLLIFLLVGLTGQVLCGENLSEKVGLFREQLQQVEEYEVHATAFEEAIECSCLLETRCEQLKAEKNRTKMALSSFDEALRELDQMTSQLKRLLFTEGTTGAMSVTRPSRRMFTFGFGYNHVGTAATGYWRRLFDAVEDLLG